MVKNVWEDVVAREFERLRETMDDVPDTDSFRDDVFAYALNRLPPRYVTRRTGQVVTNLSLGTDQEVARVSVILLEAIRVVRDGFDHDSIQSGATPVP